MVSTALRSSSSVKCPYLAAIFTIVESLQPTILAILVMGTPASTMRETLVCFKS